MGPGGLHGCWPTLSAWLDLYSMQLRLRLPSVMWFCSLLCPDRAKPLLLPEMHVLHVYPSSPPGTLPDLHSGHLTGTHSLKDWLP